MKYKILVLLFLCSCSASKRFDRLISRHPRLIGTQLIYLRDTIIKKDTLILFQRVDNFIIKQDTVINTKNFYIEKTKDILKIITKQDTIFFTDTIFYEKKISAPIITKDADLWHKFKKFWISFWFFVGSFLIIRYLFKYYF
jgi:hypothetical protein